MRIDLSFKNINSFKEVFDYFKENNIDPADVRVLYLEQNNISKIEGLEGLVNLEGLHLSSNNISKIEGLEGLVKLKWLYLDGNKKPLNWEQYKQLNKK